MESSKALKFNTESNKAIKNKKQKQKKQQQQKNCLDSKLSIELEAHVKSLKMTFIIVTL